MRKPSRRIIAGLLTAAMILPMTVSFVQPLPASAGFVIDESEFNFKIAPWELVTVSPARQNLMDTAGAAHIRVLVPEGESKSVYDLQFVCRNLRLKKDHKYEISFRAKSERSGMELRSSITSADGEKFYVELDRDGTFKEGPDMGGMWGSVVTLSNEYQEFSGTFTATEDLEYLKWMFSYAKDSLGIGGNAREGDELWFDDMILRDLSDDDLTDGVETYGYTGRSYCGGENNYISVNQLGYYPDLTKIAVLGDNSGDIIPGVDFRFDPKKIELEGSYDYELVQVSDDKVVFTGKTGTAKADRDSGDTVCKIDFSQFNTPGEYYLRIKGKEWRSFPFRIADDIYQESKHDLLTNAVNYFFQNRAGLDIQSVYITSGQESALAHPHNPNDAKGIVQKSWPSNGFDKVEYAEANASSTIDTSGGWYSNSFPNKEMTESGLALWTLQNLYERAAQTEEGKAKFANGSGTVVVPENEDRIPDILNECKYELDFMEKMKVQADEETWGERAGMYYHALIGAGYKDRTVLANGEPTDACYAVLPPTFAATLHYAACAAQGARLFAPYDRDYAAHLMKEAKAAYQAYRSNWYEAALGEEYKADSLYAPQYYADCDQDVSDEAYWAASELYITAKTMKDADADTYLKHLTDFNRAFTFSDSIYRNGGSSLTMFNQIDLAAAGSLSLLMHKDLLSDKQGRQLEDTLLDTANVYLAKEDEQGYGLPYGYQPNYIDSPDYVVIEGYEYGSNTCVLNNMIAMAYAYDLSGDAKYLSGAVRGMDYLLGTNPMSYSFITGYGTYRVKEPAHRYWGLTPDLPAAPDGVIVSGPNAALQDNYVKRLGMFTSRNIPSQHCYADAPESISTNESTLTGNAALAWVTAFLQEAAAEPIHDTPAVPGDADGNGKTGVSDAVMVVKYLVGDSSIKSPAAADLNEDEKVNAIDLSLLKQMLLE